MTIQKAHFHIGLTLFIATDGHKKSHDCTWLFAFNMIWKDGLFAGKGFCSTHNFQNFFGNCSLSSSVVL